MKNVIIIGAGGIGNRHIRGYLKTGRAALHVVEPDDAKRNEVLNEYDIVAGHADISDVGLGDFDLGVICAPAHVHMPLGQACADAGLPFLVEKPLAVTMEGVDELIDTVGRKGIEARVGYVRRSGKELIEMRRQILDGKIGDLKMSYMNASQSYPHARPDYQKTYYAKKAMGGGAILDAASHLIDILIWFFGDPSEVSAMYDQLEIKGVECEDCCLISIRFRNGGMAQITINQFQIPNICTLEMIGTEGNLKLDMSTLMYCDNYETRWEETDYMDGMAPMDVHEARFALQANMMLDAIDGKACHLATLDEARANLRVALAAKESYETKKIIQL